MESHPYEIVPSGVSSRQQCSNIDARGGRCRMLTTRLDNPLCPHHSRKHLSRLRRQQEADARKLLGDVDDFSTPDSVNIFLGNLLRQMALKRVDRLDAIAMAYVGQLMLNSYGPLERYNRELERLARLRRYQRDAEAFEAARKAREAAGTNAAKPGTKTA
jgi:hypothetical protein